MIVLYVYRYIWFGNLIASRIKLVNGVHADKGLCNLINVIITVYTST